HRDGHTGKRRATEAGCGHWPAEAGGRQGGPAGRAARAAHGAVRGLARATHRPARPAPGRHGAGYQLWAGSELRRAAGPDRAALRPGARVVAGGWKWPSNNWLLWPLRACVTALYGPLIADFSGFERPWRLLADYIPDLQVTQLGFGVGYLAQGTIGRKSSSN